MEGQTEAMFTEFSLEDVVELEESTPRPSACIPVSHNKQRPDMHEGLEEITSESDSGLL